MSNVNKPRQDEIRDGNAQIDDIVAYCLGPADQATTLGAKRARRQLMARLLEDSKKAPP